MFVIRFYFNSFHIISFINWITATVIVLYCFIWICEIYQPRAVGYPICMSVFFEYHGSVIVGMPWQRANISCCSNS